MSPSLTAARPSCRWARLFAVLIAVTLAAAAASVTPDAGAAANHDVGTVVVP